MTIQALYNLAEQQHIEVICYPLPETGSMSILLNEGNCYIGMDATIQDGSIQERTHMSHELGHCMTGSFYNIHTAVDCRQRHENRADKWAILNLISLQELDDAVAAGYCEIWDLAEHFGVTEDFMKKAICYYVHGNVASELYF